jgi:hypothetical protein
MQSVYSRTRRTWPLRLALPLAGAVALAAALLPGAGSAQSQAAPANTGEPRILGTAVEGRTLTATTGSWSGSTPMSFTYRWLRCPTDGGAPDGSNCASIGNATSNDYRVRDADVGLRLRVRVTATNTDGSASAASNPTPIVTGAARPRNVDPPTISGNPVVGATMTASPGTWSGTTPIDFSYQWRRCDRNGGNCSNISNATGRTYVATSADVGHSLRVRVTARNANGTATATSAPTAVIVSGAPSGCPAGDGPVAVQQLAPPARLLVDRLQSSPTMVTRGTAHIVTRLHVSACGGRNVAGALVYATTVPFNQFSIPPEQQTGQDGWVTLQMDRLSGFPAARRQQLLVMFVRARKQGESVLGGVSTRRLVSFPVRLSG